MYRDRDSQPDHPHVRDGNPYTGSPSGDEPLAEADVLAILRGKAPVRRKVLTLPSPGTCNRPSTRLLPARVATDRWSGGDVPPRRCDRGASGRGPRLQRLMNRAHQRRPRVPLHQQWQVLVPARTTRVADYLPSVFWMAPREIDEKIGSVNPSPTWTEYGGVSGMAPSGVASNTGRPARKRRRVRLDHGHPEPLFQMRLTQLFSRPPGCLIPPRTPVRHRSGRSRQRQPSFAGSPATGVGSSKPTTRAIPRIRATATSATSRPSPGSTRSGCATPTGGRQRPLRVWPNLEQRALTTTTAESEAHTAPWIRSEAGSSSWR